MNCAEFQIVSMKGLIHLSIGAAVEFNRIGTNGLMNMRGKKLSCKFIRTPRLKLSKKTKNILKALKVGCS